MGIAGGDGMARELTGFGTRLQSPILILLRCASLVASAFGIPFLLFLLAGCDSISGGTLSSAGASGTGTAGSTGTAGAAGSSHGATVSFPSTTSIAVRLPQSDAGGASNSGGASGSGGAGGTGGSSPPAWQCAPDQPSGTDTGVCGDGFRGPTEACDDGNTLSGDGCSPTCQITPQLVSPRVQALGVATRINAGSGDSFGAFAGDTFFNGGWDAIPGAGKVIDTSGVVNPAPQEVYQSERWGGSVYTFNGLSPGVAYTVRLHFAEVYYSNIGDRIFSVLINGVRVLEELDIVAVAGGPNKAIVREFKPVANDHGQVIVSFENVQENPKISALELIPPDQAPIATEPLVQVNAGGDAVGSFSADQFVDGGTAWMYGENLVTTGGVRNSAPRDVYQTERYGNFSYTLGGLTPDALYIVRLHFAESYYNTPGQRAFNVWINGGSVLEYFDIVAAGGVNKAVVRDFSAFPNAEGQIVVSFEGRIDNAKLNALELLKPIDASGPALSERSIGAGRHPLVAGCNTLAVAFSEGSEQSGLYLSTFTPSGQPISSAQVAQTNVSAPEPCVAVLPGDDFVVTWTDFDDDELGVSLRKVVGGVPQGEIVIANEDAAFSQSGPDVIFDGNNLVVAWTDSHDPANGPDLHYRLFTPELKPLTGDQVLAATGAAEDDVVLAGRNGHWAAAWRSGSQGKETIEVQSGASHWTVGPFFPGAANDRPDLIFLDETHLAVAFTMGTDPDNTGVANVPRLHAAVLDPNTPGATQSFALMPAQLPYSSEPARAQTQPNLVLASDHVLVAWRSEAKSGEHIGSELWSKRVPFTVSGDTITLDPSLAELPLIKTDAQREGDQESFRMVATTLWPSGGIATVWDDSSRSFGAVAGGPDAVLQVGPDFKEPTLAPLTSYAVSDDGLYYKVNLLRRNYPGPTISRTYQGDATYFVAQLLPEYVFDGDDNQWGYSSASGTDPNAGATLTIDMGQYFSVGAVRILYYYTGNTAATNSLRLGTTPTDVGNWQTVLNNTPGYDDRTYSFNAIAARFLELKMKGAPRGLAMEIEVFPSTQSGPPPSPTDGYDLSYFATATVNNNCNKPVPWLWPSAAIVANVEHQGTFSPYATGDCVGTYDLGAQYPISRVYTNFFAGSNWANGGRVDVAAVPGAYTNVYDSGFGHLFDFTSPLGYTFPTQPVRYVRLTDYAIPGGGPPSSGIMESIQVFATPPARTAYFPLSDDSKYFKVNLLRRPSGVAPPTATVTYGGSAAPHSNPSTQLPANVFDGDDLHFWWFGGTNQASASATMTVDLGQVVSLGAIRQVYNLFPTSYGLRVAETSTSWTTIVDINSNTAATYDQTVSFASKQVRYIELTMKGNGVSGVMLRELMAYPSSTAVVPGPSSLDHLDLTYLNGITAKPNANMAYFGDGNSRLGGAWRGKTIAEGATSDATFTVDLGQQYQISQVNPTFYGNWNWPSGGKVEVDDGSGSWSTVYDSTRGVAFGPSSGDGPMVITFSPRWARFVRLTEYLGTASNTNMQNIEIF
jgi:cysteine-rich repeat protein